MNKKITILVLLFLLFVPFRLPIGVLFIHVVTMIANIGSSLSDNVLVSNVIVTKIIYDLALSVISIYNVEMLSRKIKGRKASFEGDDDHGLYWWCIPIGIFLLAYIIFDGITTYDLYFALK